jgi:NAD(P)-dependent dehydrogenase (short-subunit alcohol dehydrogenase family)
MTSSSPFSLDGRTVLVTGAGRGLGRAIAVGLAAHGARVVAVSRSESELAATAAAANESGSVLPVSWDLSRSEGCAELVAAAETVAGPVHGVIHGAGIQHREAADDFALEDWRRVNQLNLEAPFFLSTAVHRRQVELGIAGSHVFVGSLASSIGLRNVAAYAAAKSGVLGVVRALSAEWAPSGTRVNCIGPGYFRTSLTEDLLSDDVKAAWVHSRIPMARLGQAEELAGVAAFLISDASSYVTGELINVDGGWLAS